MCWNQHVSINTFVFVVFSLAIIYYNNTYSSYKLEFFNNPYAYLFILSVVSMQLVEFFLWRNLGNKKINNIWSIIGSLVIAFQPAASILLIKNNIPLRNTLLLLYSIPTVMFVIYNLFTSNIHTILSPLQHLNWKWWAMMDTNMLYFFVVKLFYLFFMFFPFIYNKYYKALVFLFLYIFLMYRFNRDGSYSSLWCLSVNSVMFYFLIDILVVMPFKEITE